MQERRTMADNCGIFVGVSCKISKGKLGDRRLEFVSRIDWLARVQSWVGSGELKVLMKIVD